MKTVFLKELKMNMKNFFIWCLVVGGMGFGCIILFQSMKEDMDEMASAFSNMGAFSDAFGMSTLSIATLKGYFSSYIGAVHGLGSAMYAAIAAIGILSKEEEGHTGEFLFSLPISRKKIILSKALCLLILFPLFTLICTLFYIAGFAFLGEGLPAKEFILFMACQLLMNIEIGSICFAISALSGKNRMGMGLGVALICYVYDLIGRVVPIMEDYLFLFPFSYANATTIFCGDEIYKPSIAVALIMIVSMSVFSFIFYSKRDLAS